MKKFSVFYNSHKERLFAYLMRCSGDYYLSKDIMQESFTRYLERYEGREESTPLLFTIARNLLVDSRRRTQREEAFVENRQYAEKNSEDQFMVRAEYRQVLSALQRLDPSERDIISLVISSDLSYREIAEVTGLTVANVKVKVHRARVKLKQIYEEAGNERFSDKHVHRQ